MISRLYNFFLCPYINVFYCVRYHVKWETTSSLLGSIIVAVKDAWREASQHNYLSGNVQ